MRNKILKNLTIFTILLASVSSFAGKWDLEGAGAELDRTATEVLGKSLASSVRTSEGAEKPKCDVKKVTKAFVQITETDADAANVGTALNASLTQDEKICLKDTIEQIEKMSKFSKSLEEKISGAGK